MTCFHDGVARGDRSRRRHSHGQALLVVGLAVALLLGAVAAPPVHTAMDPGHSREGARSATVPAQQRVRKEMTEHVVVPRGPYRFPALSSAAAWARLPRAVRGGGQPLPLWARTLAAFLPQTTAAMLELDYLHRARTPLPPRLRAELRWVASHADRCPYGQACAAADLRDAGAGEDTIRALAGNFDGLPNDERAALRFARQLTLAGDRVTDDEVAHLLAVYGEKQVVGMVLLLAHATFQDRLLLALGLGAEDGDPVKPLDVRFEERPLGAVVARPLPPMPTPAPAAAAPEPWPEPNWLDFDGCGLRQALEQQRARRSRIALPANRPGQIHWGLVCRAYQPELAAAWSACGHAFAAEAEQDPVFEQSLFWVITRSLHCFY